MKNRAKCRLCGSVLESFHEFDHVECSCGEISITGGNVSFQCAAKDFSNFLRIDDSGQEIVVSIKKEDDIDHKPSVRIASKKEILSVLTSTIDQIKDLPAPAMISPLNHYDYLSILSVLQSILTSDLSD